MASGIYKRKPFTKEHIENMRISRLGKKLTLEHRKKLSEAKLGKHLSKEHILHIKEAHLKNPPNKNRKFTKTWIKNLSEAHIGKGKGNKNGIWKGDDVGYFALHAWMKRNYGKPNHCEECGSAERKMYHWANLSHKYKRDRDDWMQLCVPCHMRYDKGVRNGL